MNGKKKLVTGLLALGMIGGAGMIAAPGAAAVTEVRENYTHYSTKSECEGWRSSTLNRLRATGREVTAYTPCHYNGAEKWKFQVWYI